MHNSTSNIFLCNNDERISLPQGSLTMAETYRSLDDINRLLASIISLRPSFYGGRNPTDKTVRLAVIPPLLNRSAKACQALKRKQLDINAIAEGGFGKVGPLFVDRDRLYLSTVSFDDRPPPTDSVVGNQRLLPWTPFYIEVVAKENTYAQSIFFSGMWQSTRVMYTSNEFLHEAIVSGFTSHLYDMGILPHVPKHFGLFVCLAGERFGEKVYSSLSLTERVDLELADVLGRRKGWASGGQNGMLGQAVYNQLNIYDIQMWMVQLAHTFYTMKAQFGITHYDTHLRNIMLTHVKNTGLSFNIPGLEVKPHIYGGKKLDGVDYIIYRLPFKRLPKSGGRARQVSVIVENNGLFPKVIDFGISSLDTRECELNPDLEVGFEAEPSLYRAVVGGAEALDLVEQHGDIEYNFTAYNIVFQLYRLYNDSSKFKLNPSEKARAKELLDKTVALFDRTVEDFDVDQSFAMDNGDMYTISETFDNRRKWFMDYRAVGTTQDPALPLVNIYDYLRQEGKLLPNGDVYITRSGNPPNIPGLGAPAPPGLDGKYPYSDQVLYIGYEVEQAAKGETLNQYLQASQSYFQMCMHKGDDIDFREEAKLLGLTVPTTLDDKARKDLCQMAQRVTQKLSPDSKLRSQLMEAGPTGKIAYDTLPPESLREVIKCGDRSILSLHTLRMRDSSLSPEKASLLNPKMGLGDDPDYQEILPVGGEGRQLVTKLVYYDNGVSGVPECAQAINLGIRGHEDSYDVSKSFSANGFIMAGGPFVRSMTASREVLRPIGFYYNDNMSLFGGQEPGLPLPTAYQRDWVVIKSLKNVLSFERYDSFLNRHVTEKVSAVLELGDSQKSQPYSTTVRRVKLVDGEPQLKKGGDLDYNSAMSAGPILVWDGKPIMNRKKVANDRFILDVIESPPANPTEAAANYSTYRVYAPARNSQMYSSEPNETQFQYARDSNHVTAQSVIAQTRGGRILFILIEGLGLDAIGVDRARLSSLLAMLFNIEKAVAVNSGFAANAVFKTGGKATSLMPANAYLLPTATHIQIQAV